MTDRMPFERHMPLHLSVERFIRPYRTFPAVSFMATSGNRSCGREVLVRAFVPKSLDTDEAIEAAAGLGGLCWTAACAG